MENSLVLIVSCFGSTKSRNKRQNRMYFFYFPRRGVFATHATRSYFPLAIIDSSGDMFYYDDGNCRLDMVSPINKVKNPLSPFKGKGKDI
jgi:hypothetical protein